MTRCCTRKNMRKNAKCIVSTIGTIPTDLASDIMARVAANSLTDIANIKLSCKVLKEIAEDPHVYQNASLKKFPVGHWWPPSKEEKTFLNKCWEYGNPELLYRRGVTHPAKKHAWPPMTIEEEDVSCDACIGDAELAFIFDGLPGIK
ncbi:uncharacterized protein LOC111406415 [Olea europaea var. sylvestris]|uniref:uncharacterized protein LOC111406415 n=1 Tax=Olea europaea var. sylvestris TaxID=158386 RepID=UPI000C1CEECA|nr:uncharacterized protein LOC111406415 [Olea europaea var. sylvestris]